MAHLESVGATYRWDMHFWRFPKDYQPTKRDWSAIYYACDEWDFGGCCRRCTNETSCTKHGS